MLRPALALLPAALLAACDPGCEAAEGLEAGTMSGVLDDADFIAAGTSWFVTETGVQVSAPPGTDDYRVTFVAQTTITGHDAGAKTKHGGLPIDVTLLSGQEGGWATVNRNDTDTFSTADADGGSLRLSRKGGGDLYGCGFFTANNGRRDITATLAFRALESDVGSD